MAALCMLCIANILPDPGVNFTFSSKSTGVVLKSSLGCAMSLFYYATDVLVTAELSNPNTPYSIS